MLRRVTFVLTVLACVGIAYAAANKIRSFETYAPEPADADGMAILNYVSGQDETVVQVIISDFTPEQNYDLVITNGIVSLTTFDALTTDHNGHGTFHGTFFFDKSTWDVELYVDGSLRARGINPAG